MLKSLFHWRNNTEGHNFDDLETLLEASLTPITPRPQFVRDLHRMLVTSSIDPVQVFPEPAWSQYLLMLLAGLVSGFLLIGAGIRAAIAILAAVGILQQINQPIQERQPIRLTRRKK